MRIAFLAGLILSLALNSVSAYAADDALTARVDEVLDRALAEQRLVGAVVLVSRDGELVYGRAAGLRDREAAQPMTEDTIFLLASVSKPIVSAALMDLVEEGRIDLDDPVTRWLPDFRPSLPDGRTPVIRIRHLLTHTAGLDYGFFQAPDGPYRSAGISDGMADPQVSLDENLKRLAGVPLSFEPGTGWNYSLATDVLGAVLERETGQPLPKVVADHITGPLGMRDTGFTVTDPLRLAAAYADGQSAPVRMRGETAVTFGSGEVVFLPERIFHPEAYPSGGAGMVGTAGDILRFLEAIRQDGAPVLEPETVAAMTRDHVGPQAQTQGPGWGFGLASAVLVDEGLAEGPQNSGTLQWGGAYGHNWFVDREARLTVVALTNTTFEGMAGAFTRELRDAVYGQ